MAWVTYPFASNLFPLTKLHFFHDIRIVINNVYIQTNDS